MKNPYAEIELQLARTIDYLAAVVNAETDADYGNLYLQMLHALEAQMNQHNKMAKPTDRIISDSVLLHVQDTATGHVYCRILPVDYLENNNGIRLVGETTDGAETHLAFLSNTAMDKINDLLGHGADISPCDDH